MKYSAKYFSLLILLFPLFLSAQLNHFIYLQTEGKQPFYAKIDRKIFSSSVSGYLIIPKLKDGAYTINLGFPKGEIEEQTFVCRVSKDAGYLVKNFGDKGWGLFNLQTLDVVMANLSSTDIAKTAGNEKADAFSSMLSEVVNDPSIKQPEKIAPAVKPAAEVKETATPTGQEEKSVLAAASNRPVIIKSKAVTTIAGLEAEYIDVSGDKQDTITIVIPIDEEKTLDSTSNPPGQQGSKDDIPKPAEEVKEPPQGKQDDTNKAEEVPAVHGTNPTESDKKAEAADDRKFLPIEIKAVVTPDSSMEGTHISPMINSDCKAYASEEDFLKLRKKMVAEDTEDGMIAAAQKFLKSKCYTVLQVKNLSVLFLKDQGKYKFFDLAYAFVSDSHNFHTLENQLSEPYFISRFKAMVRH